MPPVEGNCHCVFGPDLWSDISFCTVSTTSAGGSCSEHRGGCGVVFPKFVNRRLDRKENGTELMVSVDRDGFGGMCGVLLPGGEGLGRVRRVAGRVKVANCLQIRVFSQPLEHLSVDRWQEKSLTSPDLSPNRKYRYWTDAEINLGGYRVNRELTDNHSTSDMRK